ncbi:MAG: sigma-70 family RNA polymerase sigma factor, partial [Ignavibacteriales bacterium]|nr:sigma-70 family RNA polymerase sigma factor [Ignavibacteriales bacterium]
MASPTVFLNRDAKILDLIRRDDERGLVLLFQDTRKPVLSYVLANHGSQEDADDMLQDALCTLWERVRSGRFEYKSRLGTFVLGIVKNRWLRLLAERRREPLADSDADPPGDEQPADEILLREEEAALVHQALDRIDEGCKKILLMFYWEERSMEDIAKDLG